MIPNQQCQSTEGHLAYLNYNIFTRIRKHTWPVISTVVWKLYGISKSHAVTYNVKEVISWKRCTTETLLLQITNGKWYMTNHIMPSLTEVTLWLAQLLVISTVCVPEETRYQTVFDVITSNVTKYQGNVYDQIDHCQLWGQSCCNSSRCDTS